MVVKKPRIMITGAGMTGLTAANKLYRFGVKKIAFELCVVEGGNKIGKGINTSEFGGGRIEMGATWIHGIGGSPVHKITQETNYLESDQPWECMDMFLDNPITIAENGYVLNPSFVDPISLSYLIYKFMKSRKGRRNQEIDYQIWDIRNQEKEKEIGKKETRNNKSKRNGNGRYLKQAVAPVCLKKSTSD
ncbi:Amine oxidase [Cynara cardunculus var. scolymus]|uniref:Amine oxidase n=1 Tax=Cynara cardunculus var. scolymus TaxID=59895 RepID=A0A103XQJ0_CYNCS|nr:Amine oxidase [Cynara cardunculus var. scolymus]